MMSYAKMSMFYATATGRTVKLLPMSVYMKPAIIPIKSYIKRSFAMKNVFAQHGKYTCPSNENTMHNHCIEFMHRLNWDLVAQEWAVIENDDEMGKGDLVFQKGNAYCVIECKRKTNNKVYQQSKYYASSWKLQHAPHDDQPVLYGVWTPKTQEVIGILYSEDEAHGLCTRRRRK